LENTLHHHQKYSDALPWGRYAHMRCLNPCHLRKSRAREALPASSSPSPDHQSKQIRCGMTAHCATILRLSATSKPSGHTVAFRQLTLRTTKLNPRRLRETVSQQLSKNGSQPASPCVSLKRNRSNSTNAPLRLNSASLHTCVPAFLKRRAFAPRLRRRSPRSDPQKPTHHRSRNRNFLGALACCPAGANAIRHRRSALCNLLCRDCEADSLRLLIASNGRRQRRVLRHSTCRTRHFKYSVSGRFKTTG
jgi:hypothetical protein